MAAPAPLVMGTDSSDLPISLLCLGLQKQRVPAPAPPPLRLTCAFLQVVNNERTKTTGAFVNTFLSTWGM